MVKETQAKYLTNGKEEQIFLKKGACPDGYKLTEVGMIPENWSLCRLSDVVDKIVGGGTPSRSVSGYWGHDIPWVTVKDFATFNPIQSQEYITKKGLKNSSSNLIPKGVLVTSTRMALGKAVIYDVDVTINQDLKAIFPVNDLNTTFLYFWFQRNAGLIEELGSGSTVKGISLPDLRGMIFLKPSEIEQKAMAKALSDVDVLISSLEKLIAKKQAIKTATMQQLLTGKKRLPGFGEGTSYKQTKLGEVPEDWDMVSLGDCSNKVGSGITPKGGAAVYKEDGRPFVRSQNIGWGFFKLKDLAYIDEEIHKSFSSTELLKKDVLLNITGASIGRSAVVINELVGGNVNQHVCVIRTNKAELSPDYLNFVLLSSIGQKQIDSFQAGGNREGLNFGQIRSFYLPKPSAPAEQIAIENVLFQMDTDVEKLQIRLVKTRQIKQGMMQELLTGKTRLIA